MTDPTHSEGAPELVTGRIVKGLAEDRWVLNLGLEAGLSMDDRFVVFELGEEVTDPETGTSLGALELVKGYARAVHVQPTMSILVVETRVGQPQPKSASSPKVLSAILAQTETGARKPKRGSARPRSTEPAVGDHVRRVERSGGSSVT